MVPVVVLLKDAYVLWQSYLVHIPKRAKYTLGENTDRLLLETIEAACAASFLPRTQKLAFVGLATRKLDTAKIFLHIGWEMKALGTEQYALLSQRLDDAGRMLGGWYGQLIRQNSSGRPEEK